jgi:hypothetical protein
VHEVCRTGLTYAEVTRWFRNQRSRNKGVAGPSDMDSDGPGLVDDKSGDRPPAAAAGAGAYDPGHGAHHLAAAAAAGAGAGTGAPSSSAEIAVPLYLNPNLGEAYETREEEKPPARQTAQLRRARDMFLDVFTEFPRGSREREQLLRDLVRSLGRSDRESLLTLLRPRGPYRGSADPALRNITKLERAREVDAAQQAEAGPHVSHALLGWGGGRPGPTWSDGSAPTALRPT